jgi:hypothetical protein
MDLWVPNHKLTITKSEIRYTGAYFYNMLPPDIRSSSSSQAFKRKAHELFWDMYNKNSYDVQCMLILICYTYTDMYFM